MHYSLKMEYNSIFDKNARNLLALPMNKVKWW